MRKQRNLGGMDWTFAIGTFIFIALAIAGMILELLS